MLHVNAQGLQSTYNELKFLLPSSPKDIVAVGKTFLSSSSPMSMFEVPMMKSVSCSMKLNVQGGQVICNCQDWSFGEKEDYQFGKRGYLKCYLWKLTPQVVIC